MTVNRIPGGLLGRTTEFFTVVEGSLQRAMTLFNGRTYDFPTTPICRKEILQRRLDKQPELKAIYIEMTGSTDKEVILEKFTMCKYGALNNEPDIDENNRLSEPEYVPCPQRGNCKYEGKGCCTIMVNEGVFLSKSETEVFKLANLEDKVIADKLFISLETVKKHFQNIRKKTGFEDKKQMIHWATIKNII